MKLTKIEPSFIISFLVLVICFSGVRDANAQEGQDSSKKECCIMKNGKMMHMKNGKVEEMETEMIMKNGTKCMANGECITQQGEKLIMKDGECMDVFGNISMCASMLDTKTPETKSKVNNKKTIIYTCPKHAEIESDRAGACPKCGTELVEKK